MLPLTAELTNFGVGLLLSSPTLYKSTLIKESNMKYLLIVLLVLIAGCVEEARKECVDGQRYVRVTDGNGGVVWRAH